jgi:hypothetical protein
VISNVRWLALALVCALPGLRGGDAERASLLWKHAMAESGGDLSHPLFIDALREADQLRPWQSGYRVGRERAAAVGRVRRRALD